MGTIKIKGKIKLNQFWPVGKQDADTSKIQLAVSDTSFFFSPEDDYDSNNFQNTDAFLNAEVHYKGDVSNVIKYRTSPNRAYITVRLQGIDAPELHYKNYDLSAYKGLSQEEKDRYKDNNIEYRQNFAEKAVILLSAFLKELSNGEEELDVTFLSKNIEEPIDLIDVYARFVGDIVIESQNQRIILNHWILGNGLAYPAFYNSMLKDEVSEMRKLYKNVDHSLSKLNVTNLFSKKIIPFDTELVYREENDPEERLTVKSKILFPKVFRRYCIYNILSLSEMFDGTFTSYLKNKKDEFIKWNDFKSGRTNKHLFSTIHDHGSLEMDPEDIIFVENTAMKMKDIDTSEDITSF
jgi:endonuclease YncB( thermonuclease family)